MARWLVLALPVLGACVSSGSLSSAEFSRESFQSRGPYDSPSERENIAFHTVGVINKLPGPGGGLDAARNEALAPPLPESPRQADRQVIYNGSLMIQVAEPERIEKEIIALAKEMGGWIQKLDGPRITLRIQASKFDAAFERVAALGQVLDRKVTGTDVTDQFRDLKLRLENAEKLRVRFSALLEQAKNVQDALAVEKELGRVTEEIERLKGAIAQMQDQFTYSSVTVELRRSMPHRGREPNLPFHWVRQLGIGGLFQFEN